jgi:hypothetical protein
MRPDASCVAAISPPTGPPGLPPSATPRAATCRTLGRPSRSCQSRRPERTLRAPEADHSYLLCISDLHSSRLLSAP